MAGLRETRRDEAAARIRRESLPNGIEGRRLLARAVSSTAGGAGGLDRSARLRRIPGDPRACRAGQPGGVRRRGPAALRGGIRHLRVECVALNTLVWAAKRRVVADFPIGDSVGGDNDTHLGTGGISDPALQPEAR